MDLHRVAVTGLGAVTPVGNDVPTFWSNLLAGVNGIAPVTHFDTEGFAIKLAGELKGFDPHVYFENVTDLRRTDPFTQFAVAAAEQAMADSGIAGKVDPRRMGVYIGSGIGGMQTLMTEHAKLMERGPGRVSPLFIPMMIANMAAGVVAIRTGAKGPTLPVVTACATSSHTVGEAFRAIRHGYADVILAGGSESTVNMLAAAGFHNCKALSTSDDPNAASLPFDLRRSGFVMGEGAAVLVLEEYEHALARGARIYAEIVGYGNTCDAYHMTAPHPEAEGAAEAVRLASEEAGITGSDADRIYINAHGTGTHMNDTVETLAYKKVFGQDAYRLHISSTKSMTGHMLGATGAVEAVAAVLALRDDAVPPTINYRDADPECDLQYTPGQALHTPLTYALSSSFGFGGHNAVLAFKKVTD